MAEYEVARRLNQSTNEWETVVVDETGGGGGSQTLEQVLTTGPDGGAIGMGNTGNIVTGGGSIATGDGQLDLGSGQITQDDGTSSSSYAANGIDQDDGSGATSNLAPGSISLEVGTETLFLTPTNAAVIRAKPQATTGVALSVNAGNSPAACIDPNGVALIPAADQQVLDPSTCTPEDIANALIALGLAKAS